MAGHAILALILCLCAGCNSASTTPPPAPKPVKSREAQVTVKAKDATYTSSNVSIDGSHSYEIGDFSASVKEGKVLVNGVNFGTLDDGDKVVIENDAVTVNGSPRRPAVQDMP